MKRRTMVTLAALLLALGLYGCAKSESKPKEESAVPVISMDDLEEDFEEEDAGYRQRSFRA